MPTELSSFVMPLLLIILVGLLNFTGHKTYDIAKDIWYIANPALALAAGYVLMRNLKDLRRLFKVFIIAATLVALFHLLRIGLHSEMLHTSAVDIRKEAGSGFLAPVLAIALFLVARKMKMRIFGTQSWISFFCFMLCLLSIILSFSRTLEVSLVLLTLSVLGWINFQDSIKVMLFVAFAVVLIGLGLSLPPSYENTLHPTLSDKILNSLQEIKIKEYHSMREINSHWRGFETARALDTYTKGTIPEYFVGQGLGSKVDLGLNMPLGDDKFRYIPTLHNGYMYLLVKTGIIGLFLYLLLLYRMARTGTVLERSNRADMKYCGRLIVGMSLAFASSSFVIAGMLNKTVTLPMTILLGALLAYTEITKDRQYDEEVGKQQN
jgi:O-antigen ligase